ncbi:hypothetical protein BX666DRAFT_1851746 [Dichotomocladium elegans]|nr:hypothetical protein BX666DRAFT_1851746 [Dichotomocladium elegans]
MIKNLGKLRQWTGERLGAAKMTLQTEDFQRLESDTERKRVGFEKVYAASEIAHGYLAKKKVSPEDNKTKVYPLQGLGICWASHSIAFQEDSPLGAAMNHLGELESRVAMLQEELANILKDDYMGTLSVGLHEYKEYLALKKKLESRRLDYDAKSSRLQKAKKERPEWEQEMQASKIKYEETEYDLIQKMIYLQDYEDTHLEAIHRLLEAQYMYHSQAAELFGHLRSNWDQTVKTGARHVPRPPLTRLQSSNLRDTKHSGPKRRKALYDFDGDSLEELSFRAGDVITVVEEVDEGWWLGEVENVGPKRRGIFPVNYTEEIISHRTPPTPARPVIREEPQEEPRYGTMDEESPFMDQPATSAHIPVRRPSMPSRSNSSSYQSSPPLSRSSTYVPLDTKPATRTPPPPPAPSSRMSPSISNSTRRAPPPPRMTSSLSNSSRISPQSHPYVLPTQSEETHEPDCQECGCNDFSPDVFKKGKCNNCFHKH